MQFMIHVNGRSSVLIHNKSNILIQLLCTPIINYYYYKLSVKFTLRQVSTVCTPVMLDDVEDKCRFSKITLSISVNSFLDFFSFWILKTRINLGEKNDVL